VAEAQRGDDDRERDRAEEELAWVLAALGHLGDAKALREYNALVFRVQHDVGDPVEGYVMERSPENYEKMVHTPVTARCADLEMMLWFAQDIYCTEALAEALLEGVRLLPHWYWEVDTGVLEALAANPRTHGHYRRLAANLAPRPVTLDVKRELLEHAADIPVPEVTEAIRRWTQSGDPELARDAREVLDVLGKQP
jgi:hypothetical protein